MTRKLPEAGDRHVRPVGLQRLQTSVEVVRSDFRRGSAEADVVHVEIAIGELKLVVRLERIASSQGYVSASFGGGNRGRAVGGATDQGQENHKNHLRHETSLTRFLGLSSAA